MTFRFKSTLDDHQALVTSMSFNEHFSDGPVEELQAVVPTDLLDATCIPLRVWILRPGKGEQGEGKWRIVGKALLLGESESMREVGVSRKRKDAIFTLRERTVICGC